MTSYPVPIPSRYYSNIVGLQLNEHTFDILGYGISHVAQFGSTTPEMDMRLFVNADENSGYGFKISQSNQLPVFRIGYWDSNIKDYRTQIFLDPSTGINFVDDVAFPGNDIYFSGNLGVGTTGPLSRVHIEGYKLDIDGSLYATGTLFASNLVVYGDSVVLQTTTCNTEQVTITNAGTGPALVVTQQGQGTQYAIAEFRDLDESNVAMIIADGGNIGIGTRYPTQELDVVGTVVISNNLGIGTTQPQSGFQVYNKDATFTNNVGIGTTLPRTKLDVIGIASISTNIGIGTTRPLGALHVELAPSYLAPNVGIGTTLPRQALHVLGSAFVTSSIGIGTSTPRQALHVVGANAIFSNNIGIGTTLPRRALDIVGVGILTSSLGIGTTTPRKLLDVQGDIISSTNIGIGTTTPRKTLDVQGDIISSTNIGIGTTAPREQLDVIGDAIITANLGIGTTLPKAPLHVETGPFLLRFGNIGIGTDTPTNPLHVQDTIRLANKRFSYRLPFSTSTQTIQFFKYQYVSFAPFYIRVHGQVHTGYNTMYVDVHFGGRYGYGVRTQHANVYGDLKNFVGQSVSSCFQIKFCKRNAVVDEYQGFLVLNEGASENISIDLNFDVHDGEDTFIWSATSIPADYSIYWNATQDAQMIEYDTYRFQRDPIGIGTNASDAWVNIKGLASSTLPIFQGQTLNNSADYLHLLNSSSVSIFKVASSTNVGIGTSSPQYKLDVYGNTHISTILQVDQNVGIGTATPRKTLDVLGDILSATNVGIGTTLPRKALDVIGDGIFTNNVGIGTTQIRKTLDVIGDAIITTNVGIGTTLPREELDVLGTILASASIGIGTTTPKQALDIIGKSIISQNVGIGTTNPQMMLHVDGSAYVSANLGVGTTTLASTAQVWGGMAVAQSFTGGPVDNGLKFYRSDGSTNMTMTVPNTRELRLTASGNSGENSVTFYVTSGGASSERVRIYGSNMGIGTTLPLKTLDVRGDTIISTNIGIGTTLPLFAMDVRGVGIISNNIGIGTTQPRNTLHLQGSGYVSGNIGIGTILPRANLHVLSTRPHVKLDGDSTGTFIDINDNSYLRFGSDQSYKTHVLVVGDAYSLGDEGRINMRYKNYVSFDVVNGVSGTGVEKLRIDTNGNLGIGTATPRKALDVIGDAIVTTNIGIGTATPRKALDVIGDAIVTTNIGIGTTTPRSKLDVTGSVLLGNIGIGTTQSSSIPLAIYDTTAILLPKGTTLERPTSQVGQIRYNTTNAQFEGFGPGNQWGSLGGVKDVNGDTYISPEFSPGSNDDILRFYNSNVETMRIQMNGNVGIGTMTPTQKLHVEGTVYMSGNVGIGSQNTFTSRALFVKGPIETTSGIIASTLEVYGQFIDIKDDPANDFDVRLQLQNGTELGILAGGDTNTSEVMRIKKTAVGVGTTTPRKTLDVQGDIITTTNLGIGTTTPIYPLHVQGYAYISQNIGIGTTSPQRTLDVQGDVRVGTTDIDSLFIAPGKIYNGSATVTQSRAVWIDIPGAGTLSLSDNVILNGGNLGLGTTLPSALLAVSGGAVVGSNFMGRVAPNQGLIVQGNVGIGTTQPREELDVIGSIITTISIGIGTTTVPRKALDVIGDGIFTTNIGIGTVTPRHALDVMGSGIVQTSIGIGTTTLPRKALDVIGDAIVTTNLGIGTTTPRRPLDVMGSAIVQTSIGIGTTTLPRKALDVIGDGIFTTNIGIGTVTPRKALDVIGDIITTTNIGIGTTTPKANLDIIGQMLLNGNLGLGTTTTTKGRLHTVGDINIQTGSVQFMDTDPGTMVEKYYNLGDRYGIGQYTSGTFRAYVSDTSATSSFRVSRYKTDGSFTDMVTVNPDGNVGIGPGLVAPGERFEVSGTARISNGVILSKDTLHGMAFPQGVVRRKFTHNKTIYPLTANEMREFFSSNLTYVESKVVSDINQSVSSGDYYCYEFLGYIYTNTDGTYTFNVNSDDAGEVYIDGKLASDYYGVHGQVDNANKRTAYLTHGLHSLVLRTQEVAGGDGVILSWKKPGDAAFSVIPSIYYYYDPKDLFYSVQNQLVYTQGNVGIGTLYPRQLLDIQGGAYVSTNLGIGTTTPRKALDVIGDGIFTTNIGIGTTQPRKPLHVVGDAFITNTLGIGTTNISTGILNVAGGIYQVHPATTTLTSTSLISDYPFVLHALDGSSQPDSAPRNAIAFTTITNAITTQTPGATIQFRRAGASGYGALDLCTKDLPTALGDVLPRITILTSNVGIGTTNPLDRMHIHGNTIIQEGNLGIGTTYSSIGLSVFRTDSVLIAKGTTNERPTGVKGYIRYNTELDQFEGFGAGNTWGTLGGVKSADGLTYISAELSAGTNDSNLRFFTGGIQRAIINPLGNLGIGTTQPRKRLDVVGDAIVSTNIGIGTTVPRKQLHVMGDAIVSANIGIGTLTPRKPLDVAGEAIISARLGIGTTTPLSTSALDVAGNSRFLNPIDISVTEIQIANDTQFATLGRHSAERMDIGWGETGGADIEMFSKSHATRVGELALTYGGTATTGKVTFNQYDGTTWNVYATMDAKGNLGIGNQTPAEKLHVQGKIRTSSLVASRAVFTDASQNLATGNTTSTQIHYLSNLSSDVQAQIDTKFDKAGGTITGNVTVNSNVFINDTLFTSNLRVLGQYVIIDTATSNTDQLVIFNDGSGPALQVTQAGVQPIAKFIDHDSNIGMLIDNDGYVGLGTDIPIQRLHIEGSAFVSTSIGIGTLTPRAPLDVMGNIITSANIGIGTTNPSTALHVWGDIYANSIHFKRSTNGYNDAIIQHTPSDDMVIQNTAYNKEIFFKTDSATGARNIVSIGKIQPEVHVLGTTDFIADNAKFIVSGTNSNVGIGTLTPVHTLEVFGTTYVTKLTLTDRTHIDYDLNFPLNATIGSHGDDYANIKMPNSGRDLVLSANTFQVKTNPSGTITDVRLTVDGQGNLGIGTTSTRQRLDVMNNAIIQGNVGLGTTTMLVKMEIHSTDSILLPKGTTNQRPTGVQGYIRYNSETNQFEGFGAGNVWGSLGGVKSADQLTYITAELTAGNNDCNIRFFTSGQQRAIINPLGNLGIGTTNPSQKLDVNGNIIINSPAGALYVGSNINPSSSAGAVGGTIYFGGTFGDAAYDHTVIESRMYATTEKSELLLFKGNDIDTNATSGPDRIRLRAANIVFDTYSVASTDRTAENIRMTIRGNGNVGIGTTNPGYNLQLQGNSLFTSNLFLGSGSSDAQTTLMFNSGDTATNTDKLYWTYITNGSKIGHSAGWNVNHFAGQSNTAVAPSNGNFHFFTGGPSYNERFTILNNGNIGIGTTAPRASLELVNSQLIPYGNLGIGTTLPLHSIDTLGSIISRAGNVGVGTTAMSLPLEIWSTKAILIPSGTDAERPTSNIRKGYVRYNTTTDQFEGYGAGNQWGTLGGIKDVNGDTYISAEITAGGNDDNLRFFTSNMEKMRIDKYGNVGIGTTLPLALLHIYDRDLTRQTIQLNWNSSSGTRYAEIKAPVDSYLNPVVFDTNNSWEYQTNGGVRLKIDDTGILSQNRLFLASGTSSSPSLTFTSDTSSGLYSPGNQAISIVSSNVERIRVLADGNVGIGTIAPEKRLHVQGDVHLGSSKLGSSTSTTGGPFFKQAPWDSTGPNHTISYATYCDGDNSAGNLHIQVSNKLNTSNAKIGNVMVSFIKRYGDAVNIFIISHHKSPQLTTLNITTNANDIQVTTDNDCSIAWTSIGAF